MRGKEKYKIFEQALQKGRTEMKVGKELKRSNSKYLTEKRMNWEGKEEATRSVQKYCFQFQLTLLNKNMFLQGGLLSI